jgi:hypothetical protein
VYLQVNISPILVISRIDEGERIAYNGRRRRIIFFSLKKILSPYKI